MTGESKWRKIKLALGLNTCLDVSNSTDDGDTTHITDARRRMPTTPTPSSSGLRLSNHTDISSSEQICSICLMAMKAPNSRKIFTAECSHSFHFHCIASNVKHGNRVCPVCRAKWKKTPLENPGSCVDSSTDTNPWSGMPPQQLHVNHNGALLFQALEPPIFDDDEVINQTTEDIYSGEFNGGIEMTTYPEVSAVARSTCFDNFGILINIKAPISDGNLNTRASIDLVTVLDISGSMTGTKIALLKQAMGFLVQNLGPRDRLSVIAFSTAAHRLFPLRHMTETGKQESLQMINSLVADGGTHIAEGIRKGAKVMAERKFKNPVSSMILLSDGQDTSSGFGSRDYQIILPCIQVKKDETCIPIHTFGFGMDHDAFVLHFISEQSGGMFSFIEAENVIQDAFAQCIGGLLSVVVQELRVEVECVHPVLRLSSIKAGSYKVVMDKKGRSGFIEVGDLYAEEERDFLVALNIPVQKSGSDMSLVNFRVIHKDPIKKTLVTVGGNEAVIISRPESISGNPVVSIEVDRQRNRFMAAAAIAEARTLAEQGNLTPAMSVLEECCKKLADSVSGREGDALCVGLIAELREMKERMVNRRVYEYSGRAYVLSGLSSHSWQRATTRGDSTEVTTEIHSYQTQSMVNMVNLSQTTSFSLRPPTSVANPRAAPPKSKKAVRSVTR